MKWQPRRWRARSPKPFENTRESGKCVEFLIRGQEGKQFFHAPIYRPEHGDVALPDLPGLGLVLDESKIERRDSVEF